VKRAAAAALLAFAAASCRRPTPAPTTPEATALAVFGVDSTTLLEDGASADARRAVRRLREAGEPRVVGSSPLPDGGVAVDVEASLGEGARARYAIHVARSGDGSWRIVAIGGPGVAWPARPPPASEGLSESAPPR
jgi:hypothetical protein